MMLHEYEGGWEFNSHYDTSTSSWLGGVCVEQIHHMPPDEAAALSNGQLQQTPFFLDFVNPEIHSSSNGLIVATNYLYRAEMLAYAIPSESYATGANPLPGKEDVSYDDRSKTRMGNYNMAILFDSGNGDLPENHSTDTRKMHRNWQHSTFVQRSYKRVHQLYKVIIQHVKEDRDE